MYEYKNPCIIDFKDVTHYLAFHDTIKQALDLPDYYGANMDALWDCLTEMVYTSKPLHIQVKNLSSLSDDAAILIEHLLDLLRDLKHYENDEFSQKIKIEIFYDDHVEEIL